MAIVAEGFSEMENRPSLLYSVAQIRLVGNNLRGFEASRKDKKRSEKSARAREVWIRKV